ncbi:unnamed protein product, partial [Rotaria sp. Silwood1]
INVHKLFQHENIIRFYDYQQTTSIYYLFLEYAAGGELLKKIDLKAENLLIAKNDILKICDFGLAAFFRDRTTNEKQMLTTYCGIKPYISLKILSKTPYHGEPVDIWSSGIILTTMLTG